MKIGLVLNLDERCNYLPARGVMQAGYLILTAFAWMELKGMDHINKLRIYHSGNGEDMQAALLAATYLDVNHTTYTEHVTRGWNTGEEAGTPTGESKAALQARRILQLNRNALVFAFFSETHNVRPFLEVLSIDLPTEWPDSQTPTLVKIDTEAKTIEFVTVPHHTD